MRGVLICNAFLTCAILSTALEAFAVTTYHVRLRPTNLVGYPLRVAFDFTHADSASLNRMALVSFTHDGQVGEVEVDGGPAYGDLITGSNPAALTTFEGQYFYNSLFVPFDSLGSLTTVRLDISEHAPATGSAPDEVSFYLVDPPTGHAYPTADDLGANALFAIDITGDAGGELAVFSPMIFIAPDTLALEGAVASVEPTRDAGRLRFSRIAPNPASGLVRFGFDVPSPGGRVSLVIWDVTGRKVATVFDARLQAGPGSSVWALRTQDGRDVPQGVYLGELRMNGQSAVRKLVVGR